MNPIGRAMLSFTRTLYFRFDERTSVVIDFKTGNVSRMTPVVALESRGGKQHVVAIGEEPFDRRDLQLVNPFSHDRIVLAHFEVAQALLVHQIVQVVGGRTMLRPRIIVHPLRRFSTELADVEVRALLELALSTGASWAAIHVGDELTAETHAKTAFPWSTTSGRR